MNDRKGTAALMAAAYFFGIGYWFRFSRTDQAVAEWALGEYEHLVTATARIWHQAIQAEHGYRKEKGDAS